MSTKGGEEIPVQESGRKVKEKSGFGPKPHPKLLILPQDEARTGDFDPCVTPPGNPW